MLEEEGLAAVLSDADMARALGLDLEQWMQAQLMIQEFQAFANMLMMLDPQGEDPNTLVMLDLFRFFLDWQLFFSLTPEQRDRLNDIFAGTTQDGVGNTQGGAGTGGTPGTTAGNSRSGR